MIPIHRRSLVVIASVLSSACSDGLGTTPVRGEPLHALASVAIDSTGLRTFVATLAVVNQSSASQAIDWGLDCVGNGPLDVRMFRGGILVWESSRGPSNTIACPTREILSAVAPGDTVRFERRVLLSALLGDSLDAAAYTFVVLPTLGAESSPSLGAPINAGGLLVANPIVVPPGTPLDGTWSGTTAGLTVSFTMRWRADSVVGTGQFTTPSAQSFPCAGGSVGTSVGVANIVASRIDDFIVGRLLFGTGDGPPFSGHLRSADSLELNVTTIDTPSCRLVLRKH
jgi:hypothetical protein